MDIRDSRSVDGFQGTPSEVYDGDTVTRGGLIGSSNKELHASTR
jgi:hypothetical protein